MSNTPDLVFIDETKCESKTKSFIWCNICEFVLKSIDDIELNRKYGCCEECWLTFGQMRKQEWLTGWRPSQEDLNRYKDKRRILNINIDKLIGD